MKRASIIIPAHNRRELTLACLRRLEANGDLSNFDVIVVDDGSSDGTDAAVASAFPAVRVVRGDGTLYWTGAIRMAMQEIPKEQAIVWLNDDCGPRPGALAALCDFLEKNPGHLAGPLCVDASTGLGLSTGFIGRKAIAAVQGRCTAVQGLSGFCVGLGAAAWPRLGLPDAERFPHYYGDTAYTLRASRMGVPVVLLGDAVVELADGGSPATFRSLIDAKLSLAENWRTLFCSKKSPYRLRTLFCYLRLKYGCALGPLLSAGRTTNWIARFFWLRLTKRAAAVNRNKNSP